MTSRERIEAALRHEAPDRTPQFEYVLLSPLADRFLDRPYVPDDSHWNEAVKELGWEGAVRQNAKDRIDLAQLLGHDMIYAWPPAAPPVSSATVQADDLPKNPTRRHHDDPVERVSVRNEQAGAACPDPPDHALLLFVLLKEEMRARGLDLPLLAPAYGHGIWTDSDLMQTMLLAPEVAHEHFAQATHRALALVNAYAGIEVDLIGVGGDFAGNRPLISPSAYRSFIMPEVRETCRRAHELGRRAVNASDGNLWSVADDFLLGCEVDGYLEIDWYAGMDLRRLKSTYGDRIAFFGNVDCGSVLSFSAPEEIRRHVLECIEAGLGSGGHVLCASNAITASVPPGNYLEYINTYRRRFGLPSLGA